MTLIVRSPREILFRIQQELWNVYLWKRRAPRVSTPPSPLPQLPDPVQVAAALQGSVFATEVKRLAEEIVAHRFPLLGFVVDTGAEIDWRRDYVNGVTSGLGYFRRVPYLNATIVGDHKNVWELNRHQHLVLLAQAFRLTGRTEFREEVWAQLESWLAQNPYGEGINWTSALEVAFRALSWIWIWHLLGAEMPTPLRVVFLRELYRHGEYLERNLSIYFSPNTHLLGEAVALHALGVLFPQWPRARAWERTGGGQTARQLDFQVRPDGSHFEQSTYYHVYAVDFFLFHMRLAHVSAGYRNHVIRMVEYLHLLLGERRAIPFFGDDDGGRFFHPYGERDRFGRATLATASQLLDRHWPYTREDAAEQAAWWMGASALTARDGATQPQSTLFADAGVAVMIGSGVQIVVDAGPFGWAGAGHSHADTLSVVVTREQEEILIDPGTFTYVGSLEWRERFRGVAAHNTLQVDDNEQALPKGPFRWAEKPAAQVLSWASTSDWDFLDASCRTTVYEHRRRVLWLKPCTVVIWDDCTLRPAMLHWHCGQPATLLSPHCARIGRARLASTAPLRVEQGWRSKAYGTKMEAPVVIATSLHDDVLTVIDLDGGDEPLEIRLEQNQGTTEIVLEQLNLRIDPRHWIYQG